jgi:hypothetical protein
MVTDNEITENVLQENEDNIESDDEKNYVTDTCTEKLVKYKDVLSSFITCLILMHSVHQSIGASGNGQNTQAAYLSAPHKSCSFSYINGSKVTAQDGN